MKRDTTKLIRSGYNAMSSEYLAHRGELKSDKYVRKFLQLLPKNSLVLDLGCGAGVPIDDLILKAGHRVSGVDISEEMIKRARLNCPGGEYQVGDVSKLASGEWEVEGIVSMYTMFHIPRNQHEGVLAVIASYLPKGGPLLISMGDVEFEGEHEMYGETVWASQWGVKKNRELLERVGMEMMIDEMDCSGGECHQVMLATKR